jgi:hypothetical protein
MFSRIHRPTITFFLSLGLLTFSHACLASDEYIDKNKVQEEMVVMHGVIDELFPIIIKRNRLSRSDKQALKINIDKLKRHASKIESDTKPKSAAFQLSYDMLIKHLDQTQHALNNKEYDYAVSLVGELPHFCSTCHTQDESVRHFDSSDIKSKLNSDLLRGNYHFMTRDYQEALLDFNDHLAKQRKIKHGYGNTEAMEKILLIYLNIFKDPQNAKIYFNRLIESGKLNIDLALDVNHWLHGLEAIEKGPYHIKNVDELKEFTKSWKNFDKYDGLPSWISEENKVSALWVRGLIFEFMNENPKHPDSAKLLYWLASIESALEYGLYYQLPELYLKSCVENYPSHPYAQKCYQQFVSQTTLQYTGSSGTHIPEYKQKELEALKQLIESK